MNDLNDLECDRIFGNDINFHTPKKQNESSQYKTPERNFQEISRLKDSYRFLSPATKSSHDSIEKANKESEFKYNACQLKEAQKNIIETVDHILNNDFSSGVSFCSQVCCRDRTEYARNQRRFHKGGYFYCRVNNWQGQ